MPKPMHGFDEYKPKRWISVNSLTSFRRCPRKYFFEQGLRLIPEGDEHPALLFGSAIHRGFPFAVNGDPGQAIREFEKEWDENNADKKRNLDNGRRILMQLATAHSGDRSLYTLEKPPATELQLATDGRSEFEVAFAVDVGADVPFAGYIDGAGRHRDTGELWAIEAKTTSSITSWFLGSFENNPQGIGYCLALSVAAGEKCRGTIIDAMLVSPTRGKNDSLAIPLYVEPFQLELFVELLRRTRLEIQACEDVEYFPQDFTACTTYPQHGSPGFPCKYTRLCSTEDWTVLRDMYTQREERVMLPLTVEGEEIKNAK